LLWFGVFYPSLEFFSFEVSLVMIFLVSFLYLSFFIFYFPFSFVDLGVWGVLVMTIGLCVWCNFYFWNVGCRSLRRDDMTSDQFLVTWDMWII